VADNTPASLTTSVSVSGGGELKTSNNTDADPTTIDQVADLTITKTDGGATFTQGQSGSYTVTVTNSGEGPTVGTVTVSDPGATGFTVTGMSGTGWNCSAGTSCTRSDALASGASYPPITVTVSVGATTGRSITNTASVTGGGELNTTNNEASDTTSIKQLPDLQVTLEPVGSFGQGQTGAQYSLVVTNHGTGLTTGTVSVAVDSLPAALTATAISGTGWACNPATLSCTRSDELAAGGSYDPVVLTVNVSHTAPATVTSAVTVAGGDDQNSANNTGTHTTTIDQKPDLTVALSHTGDFRQGQAGATFTITVRNDGYSPTTGEVTVTDTLPAGLVATAATGTGWKVNLGTLTFTRTDALAVGAAYPPITLTVYVDPDASPAVTNRATVSGGGEVITINNQAEDPITIVQIADLTVTLTPNGSFRQGGTHSYTLTVTNVGDGPTDAPVTVTAPLPDGLTVVSMAGTGWTAPCDTTTDPTQPSCSRADVLAVGASYPPITLTVQVDGDAPGSLRNAALVSGGGEVKLGNNIAVAATPIVQVADMVVTLSHQGALTPRRKSVPYTIRVGNAGDGPTDAPVAVSLSLPVQLAATAMSGNGWTCDLATLQCTRKDMLAPGTWYPTITLTVNVDGSGDDVVTTVATVTGGGEFRTTNNTATDDGRVVPPHTPRPSSKPITVRTAHPVTGSAKALIEGTAEPDSTVYVNGEAVRVATDGTWRIEVDLTLGRNVFTVVSGNFAEALTIIRDLSAPYLILWAPVIVTDADTIELTVTSEPDATVTIEGVQATSLTVPLTIGANTFTATATDPAGNKSTAQLSIERVPTARPVSFTDLKGHWAEQTILRLAQKEIAWGFEDGTFRPDDRVTRLDFAVMIARVLRLDPVTEPLPFTDLGAIPTWTKGPLSAALKAGIIRGRSEATFDPSAPITRAEVAVMLTRALQYLGQDVTPGKTSFTDGDQIPDWARSQVDTAARYKFITGYTDGSFLPGNTTTRAEAVTMVGRLLDHLNP
jgi:uncharacterized repeat protein (TIGR01451 family)